MRLTYTFAAGVATHAMLVSYFFGRVSFAWFFSACVALCLVGALGGNDRPKAA